MGNTKNSLKYDIKKLNPYESPFNKQKCIELLNETCFSGSFLNNKTTTKLFTPKILTLEKFNLTHMLALKQYLEDILLTCPPEEYLAYKEQLNVISKILTLDDKAYYYMETGFFHRVMAYGYTFPGEIGRLYSFSSSMPRLKREVRYLIFKNIYKDVDIENAHPSILLEYALSKNLKTLKLEQLVRDRSLFYQTVSEDLKCSISDVKIIVLKCLNQIPKEFYKIDNQDKEDSEFEFESQNQNVKDEMSRIRRKRHPLVPPLNLPKNAVEEWKQKLAIEK